ncbi:UNVERIFIED_CONTAM: hypothetical protein Sindi_2304000 [Sesamum indicum]
MYSQSSDGLKRLRSLVLHASVLRWCDPDQTPMRTRAGQLPLPTTAWTPGGNGSRDVWGPWMGLSLTFAYLNMKRTRKGHVALNILGVCNPNMQFIHVLSGWEGSAADSRVLRDAVHRPGGLRVTYPPVVPYVGQYYLCDNGYANAEGFLTPYRGVWYHLREWDTGVRGPQNYREFFNLKHVSACNMIERTFGLLKMHWGILRSQSFYPIKIQSRIILACCLLHNLLRQEMPDDPLEHDLPTIGLDECDNEHENIWNIETSSMWTCWRDTLAMSMYDDWTSRR